MCHVKFYSGVMRICLLVLFVGFRLCYVELSASVMCSL